MGVVSEIRTGMPEHKGVHPPGQKPLENSQLAGVLQKRPHAQYSQLVVVLRILPTPQQHLLSQIERHSQVQFEGDLFQYCGVAFVLVVYEDVQQNAILLAQVLDDLGDLYPHLERLRPFVGQQQVQSLYSAVLYRLPHVLVLQQLQKKSDAGLVDGRAAQKLQQKRHKRVKIPVQEHVAVGSRIRRNHSAEGEEVLTLLCVEVGIRLVFDYVPKFALLFALVLLTLGQLLHPLYVYVFAEAGDLALQEDPSACELRPCHLAHPQRLKLLLHQFGGRGIHLIFLDYQLLLAEVAAEGGHDHIVMAVLSGCEFHILQRNGIPPVSAHELGGSFEDVSGFELDEGLEGGEVFLLDGELQPLGADDVIDEIRVGKQCHDYSSGWRCGCRRVIIQTIPPLLNSITVIICGVDGKWVCSCLVWNRGKASKISQPLKIWILQPRFMQLNHNLALMTMRQVCTFSSISLMSRSISFKLWQMPASC